MDWLNEIGGLFANVATGGIFGLLGSVLSVGAKYLQERQRQAWERQKWSHETRLLELQMQATAAETEQELAVVSQQGAWSGLTASLSADAATAGAAPGWVNAVRSLFRPALTAGLLIVVWLLWRDLIAALEEGHSSPLLLLFSDMEAKEMLSYIVHSLVFAASTAVVWWFGDRAMCPPGTKNR